MSDGATIRFDLAAAQNAADEWHFNCGPGALCAVLDMTPTEIRPHLLDFETKRYTNPSLMADVLRGLWIPFHRVFEQRDRVSRDVSSRKIAAYPSHGLVRIQWDGPWCDPGRPIRARYRHTHWVAIRQAARPRQPLQYPKSGWPGPEVFDVNAMYAGGWLSWDEWENELTPWLIGQCEPKASGKWWPTHCWEITRPTRKD